MSLAAFVFVFAIVFLLGFEAMLMAERADGRANYSANLARGVIDSIEHMDPKRSHESLVTDRIASRRRERRLVRALVFSVLIAVAVASLASAVLHARTPAAAAASYR